MKISLIILIGALACVYSHAKESQTRKPSQLGPKCVFVKNGNTPFQVVDGDSGDKEYHTTEKIVHKNMVFKLMEGHGQSRLEAYKKGKFMAATFSSRSSELNLDVEGLQAQCSDLN